MPSVFHCSPFNSTFFTTCCEVAITDKQRKCPQCGQFVYPYREDMTEKEMDEVGGYYNHRTHMARSSAARRK